MTFTSTPAAGAKIRGATLSALFGEVRPLSSRLTSDTSPVSNSSALVSSGLSVSVEASKVYTMELHVLYNGPSAASDIKIGFTYPTGATALIEQLGVNAADAGFNVASAQPESTAFQFGTSASVDRAGLLLGQWVIGANAGTVTVTFAQVTPTVVNSLLRAGSRLILRQQE